MMQLQINTAMELCPKCSGKTLGWKCAICGEETALYDPAHTHADSNRYFTMKCVGCGEADVHCTCR